MEHRPLLIIALCTGIVVTILGGFVIWQQYAFAGQVFPRTHAANLHIGLEESQNVERILTEAATDFLQTPLTITVDDETAVLTAASLGLQFDTETTMARIPVITPGESPVAFFEQWILSKEIPLDWTFDETIFAQSLQATFPQKNRSAQDASLAWNEDHVAVVPEVYGVMFDQEALQTAIIEQARDFSFEDAVFTVQSVEIAPTIHAEDLTTAAKNFGDRLSQTVTFVDGAREQEFVFKDHPSWWSFEPVYNLSFDGTLIPIELESTLDQDLAAAGVLEKTIALRLNEDFVDKELISENLAPGFELAPQDVTITQNDDGTITFDGDAQNGRWIMRKSFLHSLEIALNDGIQTITLPMEDVPAKVHTSAELESLGIKELLAVGYSAFRGSPPNRMHNIAVGIAKFNGVLILKGEEFSVGDTLGYVGASTGYLPELVIKEGEILPEYGGGLCQVSSTIFRGALFAGLPITKRKAHSYAVSYYALPLGYGLDATVYPPQVDLKFMNDTPGALLLQSFVKGKEVYVKVYGTSDGRTALLDGPYISNRRTTPRLYSNADALPTGITQNVNTTPGVFTAEWNRIITYGDGKVSEDTFTSVYAAMPPHKTTEN